MVIDTSIASMTDTELLDAIANVHDYLQACPFDDKAMEMWWCDAVNNAIDRGVGSVHVTSGFE